MQIHIRIKWFLKAHSFVLGNSFGIMRWSLNVEFWIIRNINFDFFNWEKKNIGKVCFDQSESFFLSCSLISIRQNYNFDMLAMIWHEIVSWFLKIYKDWKRLAAQEPLIFSTFTFICAKQFYVSNMQKQSKAGKKSEINRQTFAISSRRYRRFRCILSCQIALGIIIRILI